MRSVSRCNQNRAAISCHNYAIICENHVGVITFAKKIALKFLVSIYARALRQQDTTLSRSCAHACSTKCVSCTLMHGHRHNKHVHCSLRDYCDKQVFCGILACSKLPRGKQVLEQRKENEATETMQVEELCSMIHQQSSAAHSKVTSLY
jgi:hypothetical protein